MASTKTLEDILSNEEVDESAVSALVGSLESQLASPPPPPPSSLSSSTTTTTQSTITTSVVIAQDDRRANASSASQQQQQQQIVQNHISGGGVGGGSTTTIAAAAPTAASENAFPRAVVATSTIAAAVVNNNHLRHSPALPPPQSLAATATSSQTNNGQINHSSSNSNSSTTVVVANAIATAATAPAVTPTTPTTATAAMPMPSSTFAVNLPGAIPASGYINQFTTVAVNPNAVRSAVPTMVSTIPNGNAGAATGTIAIAIQQKLAASSKASPATTAAAAALGGGIGGSNAIQPQPTVGSTTSGVSVNLAGGIGAMQHLAAVAARQPPLIIPTSQPHQQATLQPDVYQPYEYSYSPSRGVPRPVTGYQEASDRRPHWSTLSSCAYRGHPAPQQTVITMTGRSMPTQNYVQVSSSGGSVVTTGTPQQQSSVNMVTQVMSSPQILQGVQIVNFNPQHRATGVATSTAQAVQGPKTLAPRVVIGNQVRIGQQMIGSRPGVPGAPGALQNTITLQPGMMRGTLLVKTDNGQYQLVNVGPALTNTAVGGTTYRLQSVPSGTQGPVRALTSQQVTVTLPVSHANQQHVRLHQQTPGSQMIHTVLQAQQPSVNMVNTAAMAHATTHPVVSGSSAMQQHIRPGNPATVVAVNPAMQPLSVTVTRTTNTASTTSTAQSTAASQMSPDTAKKKCKNFLSTLLRLASDQPEQVATNVRNLIQGLIDGGVPPEDFTNQLQRELNSSPQPCLIPFLKKSLPYLRQSLMTRELTIEGVRAPLASTLTIPQTTMVTVVTTATLTTTTTTSTQQQQQPPPPPPSSVSVPQVQLMTRPALAATTSVTHVVPSPVVPHVVQPTTVASHQVRMFGSSAVNTVTSIAPHLSDLAANRHLAPATRLQSPVILTQTANLATQPSIRPTAAERKSQGSSRSAKAAAAKAAAAAAAAAAASAAVAATVAAVAASSASSSAVSSATSSTTTTTATAVSSTTTASTTTTTTTTTVTTTVTTSTPTATVATTAAQAKEKEKRTYVSTLKDDDDINDVAAMGGVNLIEESARIMAANAEFVGTQIRSCKDENFLFTMQLMRKIRSITARFGLEEPSPDVAALVSHATQLRLKDVVEKLGVIADHRLDIVKSDPRHEVTQDVRGQLKFLEELDKLEKKRHEEQEREILMRAAKSRSKLEDPEQLKLKQKAKEMQRAELEEMRQREANMTALLAIGPRKKFKPDVPTENNGSQASTCASPSTSTAGTTAAPTRPQMLRPRVKRVNLRDLVFLMEQERDTCRSLTLYKTFFK